MFEFNLEPQALAAWPIKWQAPDGTHLNRFKPLPFKPLPFASSSV